MSLYGTVQVPLLPLRNQQADETWFPLVLSSPLAGHADATVELSLKLRIAEDVVQDSEAYKALEKVHPLAEARLAHVTDQPYLADLNCRQ